MVIGVTSASRYAFLGEELPRMTVLASAAWLVVAWSAIDAAIWLLTAVFQRGRARLAARRAGDPAPSALPTAEDWRSALAIVCAVQLTLWPPVLPLLLPLPEAVVTILSNLLSVAALAWIGWFWARWTDFPRWAGALAVAAVGVAAVAVTLLLGVA